MVVEASTNDSQDMATDLMEFLLNDSPNPTADAFGARCESICRLLHSAAMCAHFEMKVFRVLRGD